jgi:protein SCO1/2
VKSSALPYWLAFAVLLAAAYGGFKMYQVQQSRATGGVVRPKLPPLEEFVLTDQNGEQFRSADMKGRVWVTSFFFTTCPSSCAKLNANIKYLTTLEELADVKWVSITVDPLTDTEQALQAYAKSLGADTDRWRFCREENFDYVKRLANEVLRVGGVNYKGHNDYVVVIDKYGKIAGLFNGYDLRDLENGVTLLKECLAEEVELNNEHKTATGGRAAQPEDSPAEAA